MTDDAAPLLPRTLGLSELTETGFNIAIEFENPEFVSLSSQNLLDSILIRFDERTIINDEEGYSLVFDQGEKKDGGINFEVPAQP